MVTEEQLKNYEIFIDMVTEQFATMFEYQKEYMCCKAGCSLCCETGMYPFSELEFEYLKTEYLAMPENVKEVIRQNVREVAKEYNGEHFLHKCPFLINGVCSVYNKRGIICRSHGLITENSKGILTIPHCAGEGLNYGKVYNIADERIIEEEKIRNMGYNVMPKAYNVCRDNIMNLSIAKKLNLEFGESRMLLEWMLDLIGEE